MADSIYTFDPTPADNTALDSIPYGPNQLYHNQIDNWFRAMASKLAQFVDDLGAVNTVSGTDTIAVTLASDITAYAAGQMFRFVAANTNTGAATMNVNTIGAKAIRKISSGTDVALSAGDIAAGETYFVIYRASANSAAGAWILIGGAAVAAATTSAAGIVELATTTEALEASSATLAVTPAGLANLYSLALNNAIEIADLKGSRLNMAGGIADAYDSETDVDTATSTNESYDSGNDLYSPTGGSNSLISTSGLTKLGNLTGGGGLAAAFDGTTTGTAASGAFLNPSVSGYNNFVGVDWGSGVTKTVTEYRYYGPNDAGPVSSFATTIKLQGSNDNSSWTDLHTSGTLSTSANTTLTVTSGITTSTAYRYHRIAMNGDGSSSAFAVEVQFYEAGTINNMTLVSNAFTASAVPTVARVATFIDPQVAMTINTDFTAEASRDGGSTWTAITLALVSNPVGTVEQYEGSASISAQPSGSSMKYRLKTLNNKDIDVTGTVFQWS